MPIKTDKFLTVKELAALLRCSESTISTLWPKWRTQGVEIIRPTGAKKGKLLINRKNFEEIILKGARV